MRLLILVIPFILLSCSKGFGHQVIGDQLTVFYTDESDQELAEKVANYFREHQLLTGKEQAVQLYRSKESLQLRLIATDTSSLRSMSFDEKKILLSFQDELNQSLNSEDWISLCICDDRFKPLYVVEP